MSNINIELQDLLTSNKQLVTLPVDSLSFEDVCDITELLKYNLKIEDSDLHELLCEEVVRNDQKLYNFILSLQNHFDKLTSHI